MNDIHWIIFELAVNFYQSALVIETVRMILGDKKNNEKKSKVCYLIFVLILFLQLSFVNSIVPFEGFGIIISICIIYAYTLVSLRGTLIQKLFWSVFSILLIMGTTAIIFNLEGYIIGKTYLDLISQKDSNRFLGVVIIQVILFYLTRVIIKKVNKEHTHSLKWNEWIVLLIIPIISVFTMTFVTLISINAENEVPRMQQMFSIMALIGILGTNFLVYGLYIKLQKEHEKQLEYEMLQQRLKSQEKSAEETKALYQSIRNIRHDLKQHFGVALVMLHEGKYEDAIKYLETYNDTVIDGITSKIFCHNEIINYILNSKCKVCSDRQIVTYIYVSDNLPNLADLDLCVLLGNAIDNAIEGIPKTGKKEIYVELSVNDNFFIISVKNSIEESVLKKNPNLDSTKNEKGQHGLGILSMKEIAKKYNGSISFCENNGLFCCDILLDIPENMQFKSDEIQNRTNY